MCLLVESALLQETIQEFERRRRADATVDDQGQNIFSKQLDDLLKFLQHEVEADQRVKLVVTGVTSKKDKPVERERTPTASMLHSSTACIFCGKSHHPKDCNVVWKMSIEERSRCVQEHGRCFRCLEGSHLSKFCSNSTITCETCGRRHYQVMCRDDQKAESHANNLWVGSSEKILLQTLPQDSTFAEPPLSPLRATAPAVKIQR